MSVEARSPERPPAPYPAQVRAAAPDTSVWVAASAGSGKTKVLADRVIRLMLSGAAPERILCLTFTRAAAAEMSNRINDILGRWAASDIDALDQEMKGLTGTAPNDTARARARQLFAAVLETPGGMKIQTIHSFCESLLGRFPLEAGIAPHFEVLDERTAAELMEAARDEVLEVAARRPDGPLALALNDVSARENEQGFADLMREIVRERGRIRRLMRRHGGPENYRRAVCDLLGVGESETERDIVAAACRDTEFDGEGLREAVAALRQGSEANQKRADAISSWIEDVAGRVANFEAYRAAFLTNKNQPRNPLITKEAAKHAPDAPATLEAEADRLVAMLERCNAASIARATGALMHLASAILDAYANHKERHARLDYDDLILLAGSLLEGGAAPWVLYKLDGGIDHILIDEAQDTNPDQWAIVRAIADEFFAGAGARDTARTIFAVGDAKQSIFSFQRADPEEFARMNAYFARRAQDAAEKWDQVELDISFRSTAPVLQAVDAVFAEPGARDGLGEAEVRHVAHRTGQRGLVELWPAVRAEDSGRDSAWTPPPTQIEAEHAPPTRLAMVIAGRIARWLRDGERLDSRDRPVRAGDILVLVQRRTGFVDDLVRQLKLMDVPVAGADRLVLSDHLAVMDLVALGQFLLLPADDLTLAAVLKGPLIGFDEEKLFELAHERGGRTLWHELARRASDDTQFAAAREGLAELLARVDYVTPFALYADLLGPARGRDAIVARLGVDANDPLDEFLSLALAYERSHPPSLQGFLQWFVQGRTEIKRDLEQGERDEVRIMTVHGAKGLEAPVVILADTVRTPAQASNTQARLLWGAANATGGPLILWRPRVDLRERVTAGLDERAKQRRDGEYRRLLYVAMTRAEDRLYVCGYETGRTPSDGCWYRMIERGLGKVAREVDVDLTGDTPSPVGWMGTGLRLENAQDAQPRERHAVATAHTSARALPPWAREPVPVEPHPPTPLMPSRPDEDEPPMMSPLGEDGGHRFRRGLVIHDLLQYLPDLAPDARREAALRYLARPVHALSPEERDTIADETLAVMEAPEFAEIFGPGSRAEVPVAGLIGESIVAGRIDRLVVAEGRVRIVDYKSNRPAPRRAEEVAPIYLRQLAAYRSVLSKIYPDFSISCHLLWTDGPRLMTMDDSHLDAYAP